MNKILIALLITIATTTLIIGQNTIKSKHPKVPYMGWSTWNEFRVNIDEKMIREQTDAMVSSGMKEAGYNYVGIDDGFQGGRDADGNLLTNNKRFPGGMKALADYIHSKGLKAGIYSDAGINTCSSKHDKDTLTVGTGLFGHEFEDLDLMLNNWGYDIIKVDWCGAKWLGLDERTRYTYIGNIIHEIKPDVLYNICRWQFPGEWATTLADSWRISGDIENHYDYIINIIDINADLWKYSSPGHFNDMDMLQVGRGMSYDEDKTHFSMWCMMNSPLLAGNDLRKMTKQTLEILTNKEIIALNQDALVYQARRLVQNGDLEVWAKPLVSTMSGNVAVALMNRSEKKEAIRFKLSTVGIDHHKGYTMRDLWEKKNFKALNEEEVSFEVPSHGVVVLKITGTMLPYNIFQFRDGYKN